MGEPGAYRLKLLGTFALYSPDGRRIPVTSKKGMALIALVAMARGGERARAWLQDRLWGSRDLEQGQASLRRELANLRAVANPASGEPLLTADMTRVRLDLSRLDVDVRALDSGAACGALEQGEFLEGLDIAGEEAFEDWLREQRAVVTGLVEQAKSRDWEQRMLRSAHEEPKGAAVPAGSLAVRIASGEQPFLPDRPSVAVRPIVAAPYNIENAAVAAGLAEEIGISLARFSTLFVVQEGGAVAAGEREEDRARIGRELGVRYLLEGSLRRSGGKLRIAIRLVDSVVREQLWAEAYGARDEDLFALQERIAESVAPVIDSSIEIAERRRALSEPAQSANAYQLYWRANALFRRWEKAPTLEAIGLAEQILAIEPRNAWAAAMAAFCHSIVFSFGWSADPEATRAAAAAFYERAMRDGGDDPFVLGYAAGTLLGIGGDLDVAEALVERALVIHPDMSATLFWGGWVDVVTGRFPRALERFERVLRINPRSAVRPHTMTGVGICLLALGRMDEAATVLTDAAQQLPHYPITLAALATVLTRLGRTEEAAQYARRLQEAGGAASVRNLLRGEALRTLFETGGGPAV